MPGGDRTGPWGAGPLTGRGAGFCRGFLSPIFGRYSRMDYGRGPGAGFGGRGFRHMFYATGLPGWLRSGWGGPATMEEPSPESEKRLLEEEAGALKTRLDIIQKLIDELGGGEKRKE